MRQQCFARNTDALFSRHIVFSTWITTGVETMIVVYRRTCRSPTIRSSILHRRETFFNFLVFDCRFIHTKLRFYLPSVRLDEVRTTPNLRNRLVATETSLYREHFDVHISQDSITKIIVLSDETFVHTQRRHIINLSRIFITWKYVYKWPRPCITTTIEIARSNLWQCNQLNKNEPLHGRCDDRLTMALPLMRHL
jgi:hypothetical protein